MEEFPRNTDLFPLRTKDLCSRGFLRLFSINSVPDKLLP